MNDFVIVYVIESSKSSNGQKKAQRSENSRTQRREPGDAHERNTCEERREKKMVSTIKSLSTPLLVLLILVAFAVGFFTWVVLLLYGEDE